MNGRRTPSRQQQLDSSDDDDDDAVDAVDEGKGPRPTHLSVPVTTKSGGGGASSSPVRTTDDGLEGQREEEEQHVERRIPGSFEYERPPPSTGVSPVSPVDVVVGVLGDLWRRFHLR